MRARSVAVATLALMGFAVSIPAQASAEAWYLMVPDGTTFRHSGSYDTARECQANITERVTRNEEMVKRLQAAIGARQRKGETIKDNDVQWMALLASGRAVLELPFSRCEVQCVGSK